MMFRRPVERHVTKRHMAACVERYLAVALSSNHPMIVAYGLNVARIQRNTMKRGHGIGTEQQTLVNITGVLERETFYTGKIGCV